MTGPDDDDALRARLKGLPRDVPPARDLWPEIAGRLAPGAPSARGRTHRLAAVAAASSLALAAAAALVMGLHGASPSGGGPVASLALSAPPPGRPEGLPGERDYEGAERALALELEVRRPSLPAGQARVLDDSLRVVDDAIASTRQALVADPEDPELRTELDRAWEDKLDLLELATELPQER